MRPLAPGATGFAGVFAGAFAGLFGRRLGGLGCGFGLNGRATIVLSVSVGFGAGDDLDQLLGDLSLALAVIEKGQVGDHLAGVAGGGIHRAHLRGVEARVVLKQRRQNLHRDVARQQRAEDGLLVRLVLVAGAAEIDGRRVRIDLRGDQALGGRGLGHHRLEAAVKQGRHINLVRLEHGQGPVGRRLGHGEARGLGWPPGSRRCGRYRGDGSDRAPCGPMVMTRTSLPWLSRAPRRSRGARRAMEELNPPARPRSAVATYQMPALGSTVPTKRRGAPGSLHAARQVGDHRRYVLRVGQGPNLQASRRGHGAWPPPPSASPS